MENPEDGRSVYLKIIDEENDMVKDIKKINERFKDNLIKDIDPMDLHLFLKINNKMLNNIKNIEIE